MKNNILKFEKWHGTGNDFIMLREEDLPLSELHSTTIQLMCDRHFGIGADGLIIIRSSSGADFHMQYFNSDGRESTMCGNGGRCAVAYAHSINVFKGNETVFSAADGLHKAKIFQNTGLTTMVELEMMSCKYPQKAFEDTLFIDTGSPHIVKKVTDFSDLNILEEGKRMRHHDSLGPGGSNINFYTETPDGIFVRTYERGVEDETLSCGTGVTAAAICHAVRSGLKGHQTIPVKTQGGSLIVRMNITEQNITEIYLEGPANKVFLGEFLLVQTLNI